MKLTKYMREAFVSAAMNDVPTVDYTEQIRKEVVRASMAALPDAVLAVWLDKQTFKYIKTAYRTFAGQSFEVPGIEGARWTNTKAMPELLAADKALIDNLVARHKAQEEQTKALEAKLGAAAASCTTRKQLAELLPEFEKYLPADAPAACRTLPAVANIVSEFTKAGWPKGKK
jgi:hypothetical protein